MELFINVADEKQKNTMQTGQYARMLGNAKGRGKGRASSSSKSPMIKEDSKTESNNEQKQVC